MAAFPLDRIGKKYSSMYDPKSLRSDANDKTFGYRCEVHSYVKKPSGQLAVLTELRTP